jgi:hypothetical protein
MNEVCSKSVALEHTSNEWSSEAHIMMVNEKFTLKLAGGTETFAPAKLQLLDNPADFGGAE